MNVDTALEWVESGVGYLNFCTHAELSNVLADEVLKLRDDIVTLKNVIRRDEQKLAQWEKRAREMHNDMIRVVTERDEAIVRINHLLAVVDELHKQSRKV